MRVPKLSEDVADLFRSEATYEAIVPSSPMHLNETPWTGDLLLSTNTNEYCLAGELPCHMTSVALSVGPEVQATIKNIKTTARNRFSIGNLTSYYREFTVTRSLAHP